MADRSADTYIHEHDTITGLRITNSILVSGPTFDQLAQYHRIVGVEHYVSADGCGWRILEVKDPVTGETAEGFQILSSPITPTRQRIRTRLTSG